MKKPSPIRARVSLCIRTTPRAVIEAFVDPGTLSEFWLASSSAPLALGRTVSWRFRVPGARVDTTATRIDPANGISWDWSDGTRVEIGLQELDGGAVAVTVVNEGFGGSAAEVVERALDATEGFAYVLAELKVFLETGRPANIVDDKARLLASGR